MSLDLFVTPPQMARASAQREYEVLVLKTSRRDKAKLMRLKGGEFVSRPNSGAFAGNAPVCSNSKRVSGKQDAQQDLLACFGLLQCAHLHAAVPFQAQGSTAKQGDPRQTRNLEHSQPRRELQRRICLSETV